MIDIVERVVASIQEASHSNAYLSAAFYEADPDLQKAVARAAIKTIQELTDPLMAEILDDLWRR